MKEFEAAFASEMREIDPAEWDALAGPYGNPLLSSSFLRLLEESGSIVPERGWSPAHLTLRREGRLIAAAPFYLRGDSWGDFVFDFEVAQAAESINAPYYPKLVGMIPATPAPAWRIMIARGEDEARISALCLDIAAETAEASGLGALQFNWVDPEFAPRFGARGRLLEWSHQSYLWSDSIEGEAGFESSAGGYGNFESYLRAFSKNMRRNVRREREGLAAAGVTSRIIRSAEAASHPKLLSRMADFYESTNDKFGPYAARFLERDFFLRLPEFMDEGWLLSAGYERDAPIDDPIGLAFLFEGKNRLFGRYWGAARFVPGLHYELCYYRPIEYALERGIHAFDPGMGSEHKARRGFRSVLAPSFHLAFDKRIQNLLAGYIPLASREASRAARALDEELPFKRG